MKNCSLAERLEDFEASLESLNLTQEPATQVLMPQETPAAAKVLRRPPRRSFGMRTIEIRDQGLRLFRVS